VIIVVLWVLFAAIGLTFALLARHNAKDELRRLGPVGNGRARLGRGHVRDETIVAVIDFVWLVIGAFYLARGIQVSNFIVAVPLLGTSALLAYSTLRRWHDRRVVYHAPAHVETAIEAQDRLVGDERRRLQAKADRG
jgi:hypothetical protein